jgi:cytochrome P450
MIDLAGHDPYHSRVAGWALCRDALLSTALVSDPRFTSDDSEPGNNFLFMDGEIHQRLRRLVTHYFSSHCLNGLAEQLEESCRMFLHAALTRHETDLVADLAEPFVLEAILSAMEVPSVHRERLGMLARDMLGIFEADLSPTARRRATNAAVRTTMLFERDRLAGQAVGLHGALETAAQEQAIPRKLAVSTPVVVLHGGFENPLNLLGCVIAWAVDNPEQFKQAAMTAPGLLLEEITRVFSPVRLVARWAVESGALKQHCVQRGELVWVDLESANHDIDEFGGSAHDLDTSTRRQHLGFGYGFHACLGARLARLEGKILISALATVTHDVLREFTVAWREGVVTRGPASITRIR